MKSVKGTGHEKEVARRMVTRAVKDGSLIRKPCIVCGDIKVVGHHYDYLKPLDVTWVCRKHHGALHRDMEKQPEYTLEESLNRLIEEKSRRQGKPIPDRVTMPEPKPIPPKVKIPSVSGYWDPWYKAKENYQHDKEYFDNIAERMVALRKRMGITQKDLSEIMKVSKVMIARVEMRAGFKPRRIFMERFETLESSGLGLEDE